MPRCVANRFDKRRCGNQAQDCDDRCHIHSVDFPMRKCLSTEVRTGKRCKKKPVTGSMHCAGHRRGHPKYFQAHPHVV